MRIFSEYFPTTPLIITSCNIDLGVYRSFLMMSEWIRATPLTAWDPTMDKWAMFTRLSPSSSINDILFMRAVSPGHFFWTSCAHITTIRHVIHRTRRNRLLLLGSLTWRCKKLIWYMICMCLGSMLPINETDHRSKASGKTVWLVYAQVFTVISHAVSHDNPSMSIRILISSGMANAGCVSFSCMATLSGNCEKSVRFWLSFLAALNLRMIS